MKDQLRRRTSAILAAAVIVLVPAPALAHGSGTRSDSAIAYGGAGMSRAAFLRGYFDGSGWRDGGRGHHYGWGRGNGWGRGHGHNGNGNGNGHGHGHGGGWWHHGPPCSAG
jgi:hypothetical protein